MLNPLCVVFPLVWTQSSIEDGTLCENVSQLEAFNCSTSYLASIKLHLRCLIGFYSKCASESCSVWHYEDTSHRQLQPHSRLLAVFKNTISCKNQSKSRPNELVELYWLTILLLVLYIIFKINKVFSTSKNFLAQLMLQLLCFRLVI